MNLKSHLILLSILSVFSNNSIASDAESIQKLQKISNLLSSYGYTCRNNAEGRYLKEGDTYTVYTNLYRENAYKLVAAGNVHVRDIDIILHDENHNTVARDNDSDPTPIVDVSPRWDGKFHAKINMYRGKGYSNLMICWKKL